MKCACGKVEVDVNGARMAIRATNTVAVLTVVNQGQVKWEHFECQACRSLVLPESQ